VRQAEIVYTHRALVTPGGYRFTLAMLDTATGGHNLETTTVRVEPIKRDPLIDSWEGLPPVEILGLEKEPDVFFHPDLTGRLHLPAANRMPVRVELLVEMPNWLGHQFYWTRASLNALIPQLKALSEIRLRNGVMNITLFWTRNGQTPVTRNGQALDWGRLRSILDRRYYTGANVINVGAYQPPVSQPIVRRSGVDLTSAQLLTELIRNRLADKASGSPLPASNAVGREPGTEPRIEPRLFLIVLAIHRVDLKKLAWKPEPLNQTAVERAYLIQDYPQVTDEMNTPGPSNVEYSELPDVYATPPASGGFPQAVFVAGSGMASRTAPPAEKPPWEQVPTLQKTISLQEIVESLNPRNFNVKNPSHFRDALGEILRDISRM
jgi:hypothetical protein